MVIEKNKSSLIVIHMRCFKICLPIVYLFLLLTFYFFWNWSKSHVGPAFNLLWLTFDLFLTGGGAWGRQAGGRGSVHKGWERILQHHRAGEEVTGEETAAGSGHRQSWYWKSRFPCRVMYEHRWIYWSNAKKDLNRPHY